MIQAGVRWKRWSCSTSGWMCGTTWIDDAPVPITATRFPRRSASWSHCAVWKAGPWKLSSPGMLGTLGSLRPPHPRDEHLRGEAAGARLDHPVLLAVIPASVLDGVVEADVR